MRAVYITIVRENEYRITLTGINIKDVTLNLNSWSTALVVIENWINHGVVSNQF